MTHSRGMTKMEQAETIFSIDDYYIEITKDLAIVRIFATIEGLQTEVTGSARRHPDDKANPKIASLLAHSRALESLSNKLAKRAQGAIKHAEDTIQIKAVQRRRTTQAELNRQIPHFEPPISDIFTGKDLRPSYHYRPNNG